MRVLTWAIAALMPVLLMGPAPAAAEPAPVEIQVAVIEATTTGKKWDARLDRFKKSMKGYVGARVLDELTASGLKPKVPVSMEILDKKMVLTLEVVEVAEDGTVSLVVSIPAQKFSARTTHKKGNATVLVGKETSDTTALFLAVTPQL